MKAELIRVRVLDTKPTFPLLAQHTGSGDVVLFVRETEGTVVKGDGFGHHFTSWSSCLGKDWRILPEDSKVILTQKF